MAHQIAASQIRPGETIIIQGIVTYARVRSLLGPKDIDKINDARRNARFKLDRNKPITRLSLHNASVIPANPATMTPEEFFVHERMYESSTHPELGRQWSIDNKGTILPALFHKGVDGQLVQLREDEIPASQGSLPTEPARDQSVTVVLNVFASSTGNNGVGIAAIIFDNEPQWFTGAMTMSIDTDALAARGLVFSGPITTQMGTVVETEETTTSTQAAAPVAPTPAAPQVPQFQAPAPAPQSTVVDPASGLAMPAPETQPVAPVAPQVQNPVAAQVMGAIAQQQAQGSPFGAAAPAAPTAPVAPASPAAPAAPTGSPWTI